MSKNFISAMPCSFIDAATLNALAYLPINLDGTLLIVQPSVSESCFMIRIINNSNVEVYVSFDGVTPHDYVAAGTSITLPFQSNSGPSNSVANLAKNSMIYVNGAAGVGYIFVAGYYQGK